MTSEGLGEMFEGDYADMCGRKFPLVSMGGRAETRERGPPSALAEILSFSCLGKEWKYSLELKIIKKQLGILHFGIILFGLVQVK